MTMLCVHLEKDQPQIEAKWCGPWGQAAWAAHLVINHILHGSLSSSQPGGPPCWTSPLAFGLFGLTYDPPPLPCSKTLEYGIHREISNFTTTHFIWLSFCHLGRKEFRSRNEVRLIRVVYCPPGFHRSLDAGNSPRICTFCRQVIRSFLQMFWG